MPKVATAILEIRTDGTGLSPGLAAAKKDVANFAKELSGLAGNATAVFGAASLGIGLGMAVKQFIDDAGKIEDLSQRLKIPEETVQEWGAFFGQAGVEIDSVAKASEKLSISLISGDKGAVSALKKMGLSIDELKAMKPEERFNKVADAVGLLQDAGERAYAAKTIFGKAGTELLSALDGTLTSSTQKMRDLGLVIDGETIKAADNFGDQLGLMGKQLLAITATIVGPLLPALSAVGSVLMWLGQNVVGPVLGVSVKAVTTLLAGLWEVLAGILAEASRLASHLPGVGGKFAELAGYLDKSSKASGEYMRSLWDKTDGLGKSTDSVRPKIIGLGGDTEAAGKKASDTAAFYANLASSMDTLSGAQVEAIRYYKEQGKSVSDIAKALGLYEQQVEQVITAEKIKADVEKAAIASSKGRLELEKKQAAARAEMLKERGEGVLKNVKSANDSEQEILRLTATSVLARTELEIEGVRQQTRERLIGLDQMADGYESARAMALESERLQIDEIRRLADIEDVAIKFDFVGPTLDDAGHKSGVDLMRGLGSALSELAGQLPDIVSHGTPKAKWAAIGDAIGSEFGSAISKNVQSALAQKSTYAGGLWGLAWAYAQESAKRIHNRATRMEGQIIEEHFQQSMGGFEAMADAITAAYLKAGRSAEDARLDIEALLAAEGEGSQAVHAQIDQILANMDGTKHHLELVATGVDDIVTAAGNAGGPLQEAFRPMIESLLRSTELTDEQKQKLQGLLDVGNDMQSVEADAQKYGVTLDQLGQKFKQFDVMRDGDALGQFFSRAKRAGADLGGTLAGIQDETQALVTQALKAGVSLPSSLQQVAKYFFDTGQLVDENGKKMQDFGRLSFEDAPIDKSSQAIVDAIDKLTHLFENLPGIAKTAASGVAGALDSIPNETHKRVIFDAETNGGIAGGMPDVPIVPEALGGTGRVLGPTLFYSAGNEDFAFSGEGGRFARDGGGWDGSGLQAEIAALRSYVTGGQQARDFARANRDEMQQVTFRRF